MIAVRLPSSLTEAKHPGAPLRCVSPCSNATALWAATAPRSRASVGSAPSCSKTDVASPLHHAVPYRRRARGKTRTIQDAGPLRSRRARSQLTATSRDAASETTARSRDPASASAKHKPMEVRRERPEHTRCPRTLRSREARRRLAALATSPNGRSRSPHLPAGGGCGEVGLGRRAKPRRSSRTAALVIARSRT
jgi:hypothetical protein